APRSAHVTAVNAPQLPVDLAALFQHLQQSLCDPVDHAFLTPFAEPVVDRLPGSVVPRDVSPRTSRTQHVEQAVEDLGGVPRNSSGGVLPSRKHWFDESPLCIAELVSLRLLRLPVESCDSRDDLRE